MIKNKIGKSSLTTVYLNDITNEQIQTVKQYIYNILKFRINKFAQLLENRIIEKCQPNQVEQMISESVDRIFKRFTLDKICNKNMDYLLFLNTQFETIIENCFPNK